MRRLRGQEGSGGHREGRALVYPHSYTVFFSRRVSRVGNLPSEEKEVVYPAVVLRFFQQKSNLRLDTHPVV